MLAVKKERRLHNGSIIDLFTTLCLSSTPKRHSTKRFSEAWLSASPSLCMVASRKRIPWWHHCAQTRTRSCVGAACTLWRWLTAAPETIRPSASFCTLPWVSIPRSERRQRHVMRRVNLADVIRLLVIARILGQRHTEKLKKENLSSKRIDYSQLTILPRVGEQSIMISQFFYCLSFSSCPLMSRDRFIIILLEVCKSSSSDLVGSRD